jgi:hypothetical protein
MRQTYVKARKSRPVGIKRLVVERDELGYLAALQRTIISGQGAIRHPDILAMLWKSAKRGAPLVLAILSERASGEYGGARKTYHPSWRYYRKMVYRRGSANNSTKTMAL